MIDTVDVVPVDNFIKDENKNDLSTFEKIHSLTIPLTTKYIYGLLVPLECNYVLQ